MYSEAEYKRLPVEREYPSTLEGKKGEARSALLAFLAEREATKAQERAEAEAQQERAKAVYLSPEWAPVLDAVCAEYGEQARTGATELAKEVVAAGDGVAEFVAVVANDGWQMFPG